MDRAHPRARPPALVSLFTGAGGLDVGLEAAGFRVAVCVEIDPDARKTLETNRPDWQLSEPGDIHAIEPKLVMTQAGLGASEIELLAGGPPCQPFSKSANWTSEGIRGIRDPRAKTLAAYLRVVEAALPKVVLVENVGGFVAADPDNGGLCHLRDGFDAVNRRQGTNYTVQVLHLNAAEYGVPQKRERVFIISCIDGKTLKVPPATHGPSVDLEDYRTAWDAIGDLDTDEWGHELDPTGKWAGLLPSIPEGENYLWHTPRGGGEPLFGWRTRFWSFLLKLSKRMPSWTIQAQPGPATGPFHWRNRTLSTDELARLQTFPDAWEFCGDRRSVQRQIGNAVPCAVGELLGLEIRRQLLGETGARRHLRLIPQKRESCPPAHPVGVVPAAYAHLRGDHADHPGSGFGPAGRRASASES